MTPEIQACTPQAASENCPFRNRNRKKHGYCGHGEVMLELAARLGESLLRAIVAGTGEVCSFVFMASWPANWAGSNVASRLLAGAALWAMELF